jgi:hypothetical protein
MEWTAKIEQCSFVGLSALIEGLEKGDEIVERLGQGSTFTWGDTNRSMVTPSLFDTALDYLDDEDCEADIATLKERVDSLDDLTYIDIVN